MICTGIGKSETGMRLTNEQIEVGSRDKVKCIRKERSVTPTST